MIDELRTNLEQLDELFNQLDVKRASAEREVNLLSNETEGVKDNG